MGGSSQKRAFEAGVSVNMVEHHEWQGAYLVSNGIAEVIVVPAIGRVMQFRIAGDETGVFWENRRFDGQKPIAPEAEWANFGGDKTWPAPQDAWGKVTGRPWPPPLAFDSLPLDASVQGSDLVLTSPVDPDYGIRTIRYVVLHPTKAKLAVRTVYCKISGAPVKAGVWIITQLRDPQRVFALLPEKPKRAPGWHQMVGTEVSDFRQDGRLVSFRRHPAANTKIGAEGNSMLWIGEEYVVRIDHDSPAGAISIYTNMDPLQYVELETEGPMVEMKAGDRIALTNTYELTRRTASDIMAEAQRAFGLVVE